MVDAMPDTLTAAFGHRIVAVPGDEAGHADEFPRDFGRSREAALLELAAASDLEPARWLAHGSPFFMAGLAFLLACGDDSTRAAYVRLAESLHPGIGDPAEFGRWLTCSPVRPSRFLPMLAQLKRGRHECERAADGFVDRA
jgi:hypothetical protein